MANSPLDRFPDIDNDTLQGLPFLGDSILAFGGPPFGLDMNPFDGVPGPGVDFITEVTLETHAKTTIMRNRNGPAAQFGLIIRYFGR